MKKRIKDLRFYESDVENLTGSTNPRSFGHIYEVEGEISFVSKRILSKLIQLKIELDEFDHLYLNFTICLKDGDIKVADREVSKISNWFRYVDVGLDPLKFKQLSKKQKRDKIIDSTKDVILKFYAEDYEQKNQIEQAFAEIKQQEEHLKMLLKEKSKDNIMVSIAGNLLDSGLYKIWLEVWDIKKQLIIKNYHVEKLYRFDELEQQLGNLSISDKKIALAPKKGRWSQHYMLDKIKFYIDEKL